MQPLTESESAGLDAEDTKRMTASRDGVKDMPSSRQTNERLESVSLGMTTALHQWCQPLLLVSLFCMMMLLQTQTLAMTIRLIPLLTSPSHSSSCSCSICAASTTGRVTSRAMLRACGLTLLASRFNALFVSTSASTRSLGNLLKLSNILFWGENQEQVGHCWRHWPTLRKLDCDTTPCSGDEW